MKSRLAESRTSLEFGSGGNGFVPSSSDVLLADTTTFIITSVNDQDTSFASRVVHTCVASFAEVNCDLATDAAGGADDKGDFGGWLGHDGNLTSSGAIELEVEVDVDRNDSLAEILCSWSVRLHRSTDGASVRLWISNST
jgi:hypothetical protein